MYIQFQFLLHAGKASSTLFEKLNEFINCHLNLSGMIESFVIIKIMLLEIHLRVFKCNMCGRRTGDDNAAERDAEVSQDSEISVLSHSASCWESGPLS